ncbi:MAG: hypothetical protein KGY99_00425 [Phycisphaerae bacterium]|nr:hypothetical protein [Phycisphaerae bacterium]
MTKRYTTNESEPPRFSRRWWTSASRNLLWVALITVLIWVYADMEFIDSESIKITLRLTTDPDRAMLIDADGDPLPPAQREYTLTCHVRGSRRSLATLKRRLAILGSPVTYDVSRGREPQPQDIETEEILGDLIDLDKLGVTVLSVRPQRIADVPLEPVVRESIPVDFRFVGGAAEADPEIELSVTLSDTKWQRLKRKTGNAPAFVTRPIDLSGYEPGKEVSDKAIIDGTIAAVDVLERTTVPFTVTVGSRPGPARKVLTLTVNVQLLTPPAWAGRGEKALWQDFVFTPTDKRSPWENLTITVQGPADDIDELSAVRDEVHAYVALDRKADIEEAVKGVSWGKDVTIRFPPGLDLRLVEKDEDTGTYREVEAPPQVEFEVRTRGAPQ